MNSGLRCDESEEREKMKSAYELAMERLEKSTPTQKLTSNQLKEIEELDSIYKARIAERETFLHSQIAQARASGDAKNLSMLQDELVRDLKSLRAEWAEKKEKIRSIQKK
jgi:hypothetical protein